MFSWLDLDKMAEEAFAAVHRESKIQRNKVAEEAAKTRDALRKTATFRPRPQPRTNIGRGRR